jgi:preprotein translocase subunit SecY
MLLSYAYYFAQAIMFIPAAVAGLSKSDTSQSIVGAFSNMFGFGIILYLQLIVFVFTFLYQYRSY